MTAFLNRIPIRIHQEFPRNFAPSSFFPSKILKNSNDISSNDSCLLFQSAKADSQRILLESFEEFRSEIKLSLSFIKLFVNLPPNAVFLRFSIMKN